MTNELDVFSCPLEGKTLIEASAGTGKTWNICWLYIRLLIEKGFDVSDILVVTFTNAATAELKGRIRRRIGEMLAYLEGKNIAGRDPSIEKMAEALRKKQFSDPEMAEKLKRAFQSFDQASVFTIHSFCQYAMKQAAFSSGQPFSVNVETDDSELLKQVAGDFWRKYISEAKHPYDLLIRLGKLQITPEDLVKLLKIRIQKPLAEFKWPEKTGMEASKIFKDLENIFNKAAECWGNEKEAVAETFQNAFEKKKLDGRKVKKMPDFCAVIEAGNRIFTSGDPFSLIRLSENDEILKHVKSSSFKPKFVPQSPAYFSLAEELFKTAETAEAALIANIKRKFIEEAASNLKEEKKKRHIAYYDDMLSNLYDALLREEDEKKSGLARTIREKFRAALIDEFQDTDPMQYEIFSRIYPDSETNPVFFVGDPKQAIYSFRSADLFTYIAAKKKVSRTYTLKENHRSVPGLIDACNKLFSKNEKLFIQKDLTFEPVRPPEKAPLETGGPNGPEAVNTGGKELFVWMLPIKKELTENGEEERLLTKEEAEKRSAEATAVKIARLISNGEKGGDIAVLVRNHWESTFIRQILLEHGISSVSRSKGNVFRSREARELECVLLAMLHPTRETFVRAAAATELMGKTAEDSIFIRNDLLSGQTEAGEEDFNKLFENFSDYREIWFSKGAASAVNAFFDREEIPKRMLKMPDGERRLTNLRHLAELIHQESETKNSPELLMNWYSAKRKNKNQSPEEEELRLETDRNLVQILTIHASKGLEFPFVFCPFAYIHRAPEKLKGGMPLEYHGDDDDENIYCIDFRDYKDKAGKDQKEKFKKQRTKEFRSEEIRLLYVAMTRAIRRCYITAGCYATAQNTLLNWMAAGTGEADDWMEHIFTKDKQKAVAREKEIGNEWEKLADTSPHISRETLPEAKAVKTDKNTGEDTALSAEIFESPRPETSWLINSFTGLTKNAEFEDETGRDHDEELPDEDPQESDTLSGKIPDEDDILFFPKGTYAGSCLHAVFENADFTNPETWKGAIDDALARYPQKLIAAGKKTPDSLLASMAENLLKNVLDTDLGQGFRLNEISRNNRLTEWQFFLTKGKLTSDGMNSLLEKYKEYPVPKLVFRDMDAYMKGFIDLVFEKNGKFWIVDWKSNHLGNNPEDYSEKQLGRAMEEHGYHLQYLLYTAALDRYLKQRMPSYSYSEHFGGVFYLFVRGVRPEWQNAGSAGIFFRKPDKDLIEKLQEIFSVNKQEENE